MRIETTVIEQVVEVSGNAIEIEITENVQTVETLQGTLNLTFDGTTASVTAATALGGHRVVTMDGNYASKDNSADKFSILGVTQGAVSSGHTTTATTFGAITEPTWTWTPGLPVFLGTNGLLTQTAPTTGFRIIIGRAITATTMFVDISEPIVL
jgi:hypothetical protein